MVTSNPGGNGEVFSYTLQKDGSAIATPAWMSINFTTRTITVDTLFTSGITKADVGVYTLAITGVLTALNDPSTGQPWTATCTNIITIKSDCVNASSLSVSVPNFNAYLGY